MRGRRGFGLVVALVVGVSACGESESSESRNDDEAGGGGSGGNGGEPVGGSGGSPANGGASSGGSAATGGASSGGQSGAGAGGAAGDGATGGAAGAGARGGSGGAGGTPTNDPDVLARAAAVLGSCWPDDGVSRNAAELWHWKEEASFWKNFRLQAECIARAGGGCRALDTCLGWTLGESPACTPGRTCEGTIFRQCLERPGYENIEQVVDCATLDLDCDSRAICVDGPAVSCDLETYVEACEANMPSACASTGVVRRGPDCAELGLSCVADSAQSVDTVIARCTGSGNACENLSDALFDGIACAGDVLEACVNGRRQDLDCTTFGAGFSCQSHSGIPFCGLASECLPANLQGSLDRDVPQGGIPEPACDGALVVFCNAGRLERIDCTALGFTGCDIEAGYGCVPSPSTELVP